MQTLSFRNGDQLPAIGLGTWKSKPGEVGEAVLSALKAGYRHIDCAWIYGNEAEIGEALQQAFREGVLKREELWVTSKLWNDSHRKEDVLPALEDTLRKLQLDYLDLYLIHWPVAFRKGTDFPRTADDFIALSEVPLTETWGGMEGALKAGKTRHIGVSNFKVDYLKELIDQASIAPEMNQVELHPYLPQHELLEFCKTNGIHLTAYSPLGSGDRSSRLKQENEPSLLENPVIQQLAAEKQCTPAQILIQWAVDRGTAVIPKSVNPGRIQQNLDAQHIELTAKDQKTLAGLDKGFRFIDGSFWEREGSPYNMDDLWK
jgi:alcohol dehydrogenase (NADP+)